MKISEIKKFAEEKERNMNEQVAIRIDYVMKNSLNGKTVFLPKKNVYVVYGDNDKKEFPPVELYDHWRSALKSVLTEYKANIKMKDEHTTSYCGLLFCSMLVKIKKLLKPDRALKITEDLYKDFEKDLNEFIVKYKEYGKLNSGNNYSDVVAVGLMRVGSGNSDSSTYEDFTKRINDQKTFGFEEFDYRDRMMCIRELVDKENFERFPSVYYGSVIDNKKILKFLIEQGYISERNVSEYLMANGEIVKNLLNQNKDFILDYMNKTYIAMMYMEGAKIDRNQLKKYTRLSDVLFACDFGNNSVNFINFISEHRDLYSDLRNSQEAVYLMAIGKISIEDAMELKKIGIISTQSIANCYDGIWKDLDEEDYMQKRIFNHNISEIMNPKTVLSDLSTIDTNSKLFKFYEQKLPEIYKLEKLNLSEALIKQKRIEMNESMHSKDKNNENIEENQCTVLDLLKMNLVKFNDLKKGDLSSDEIYNLYKDKNNDEQIIIDAYNNGLLEAFDLLDTFGFDDDEHIIKLIKKGLNADVLTTYYTNEQIEKMFYEGMIDIDILAQTKCLKRSKALSMYICGQYDLEKYKDCYSEDDCITDMQKEDLIAAYKNGEIRFDDLYELVDWGIISKALADEINESYDLNKGLSKLERRGGIAFVDPDEETYGGSKIWHRPRRRKTSDDLDGESNVDEYLAEELFKSLGAGKPLEVSGRLFAGYVMWPFVDKKVGILEGNGRTIIMPLKIFIERVENPGSEYDIIGKTKYKRDMYKYKEYVRGISHVADWGKNVIHAMSELNDDIDEETLISQNADCLELISSNYRERIAMKKRRKNLSKKGNNDDSAHNSNAQKNNNNGNLPGSSDDEQDR